MNFKNILKIAVFVLIVYVGVEYALPHYRRYSLSIDMKVMANFALKNDEDLTKQKIRMILKENEWKFEPDDFFIRREEGRVSISIEYTDEVVLFGRPVDTLDFNLVVTSKEKY